MERTYLLDSNVIYSYTLRDYFITLATGGLDVHWSTEIEAEFIRARERKSREQAVKAREVVKLMRSAVPDWRALASPARIASLALPDADDRHVLAAAIQIGAGVIVTGTGRWPRSAFGALEPVWASRIRLDIHTNRTLTTRTPRFADIGTLAPLGIEAARYEYFDYAATVALVAPARCIEFNGLFGPSALYGSQNLVVFMDGRAQRRLRYWESRASIGRR